MNRTDRLQAIITHLQSKKQVTAQEIATRFNISIRTVYRDIRALEEAGIPIGAEAGYGYYLDDEYHLPPVMFTNEEAGSILLAGKFIQQQGDSMVSRHFTDALFKIKSVLRSAGKEYLESIENRISVYQPVISENKSDTLYISKIQTALSQCRKVQINYTSGYKKEATKRTIQPIGLVYYSLTWHVIAYCEMRNDYRDFRLDRLNSLLLLDDKYQIDKLRNIENYFEDMALPDDAKEITLEFSQEDFEALQGRKYYFGYVKHEIKENKVWAYFINTDYHYVANWILTMGRKVNVVNPPELKYILQELVSELCDYYKPNS